MMSGSPSETSTSKSRFRPRYVFWCVFILLAAVVPYLLPSHLVGLGSEILIMAIFAMSLDLLMGYTGLLSFGHAAFFGTGVYVTAYVARGWTNHLAISLPVVMIITAIVAFIVGYLIVHTSGIYFLMITLAFAQMLYSIVIGWSEVTGGANGLTGITRPILGYGSFSYQFNSYTSFYYLAFGIFLVSWALLASIVKSPFGWVLRGIRENEQRTRSLGYNTHMYKTIAFTLSGMFASVAGLLMAYYNWYANPQDLYWTMSGEVLVMLIIGGYGTLIGPVLGAIILETIPYWLSDYTEYTLIFMGLIFCLFVLFAPKGIMGILRSDQEEPSPDE